MELKDLATQFVDLKTRKDKLGDELKDLNKKIATMEDQIIDELVLSGQSSAKFPNVVTIGISYQQYPKVVDQSKFFEYLENTNQQGMVKQTVNHNTLKSWFKSAVLEVEPEDIGLSVFKAPKIYYRRLK